MTPSLTAAAVVWALLFVGATAAVFTFTNGHPRRAYLVAALLLAAGIAGGIRAGVIAGG